MQNISISQFQKPQLEKLLTQGSEELTRNHSIFDTRNEPLNQSLKNSNNSNPPIDFNNDKTFHYDK